MRMRILPTHICSSADALQSGCTCTAAAWPGGAYHEAAYTPATPHTHQHHTPCPAQSRLQTAHTAARAGSNPTFPHSRSLPVPGVDVASLLRRFGLEVSGTSEAVGALTIAYAAHKALSPVRFPPTVALTPVVARWLGKEPQEVKEVGEE